MSQENVEVVRKAYENFNRGDIDALVEPFDDDVVVRTAEGWPERAIHGKLATRSFFEGYAETVGRDVVIEELIDPGDAVVVRVRARMVGEQSGIEGDMQFSQVLTLRKGKIVLAEFFWDHQQALEAAGLEEWAMSEENVELVRAAIEATMRRPNPDWETMNALFHPDHEFLPRDVGLVGGGVRGAQGYREWLTNISETMEWEVTLAGVTEIDHERVLAVMPTKFRGSQSGAETEQRIAAVVTVREGKVVRTELFQSPEQALEAVGLSE